jgi:hypothetical protein
MKQLKIKPPKLLRKAIEDEMRRREAEKLNIPRSKWIERAKQAHQKRRGYGSRKTERESKPSQACRQSFSQPNQLQLTNT